MKTLLVGLLLVLSCSAPTVMIRSTTDTPSLTSASVVTIIEPNIETDEYWVPIGYGWHATCNAFCVQRLGTNYLITAAHCVPDQKHGDQVRYLKPNGIGHGVGKLIWTSPEHDNAVVSVDDPDLVPLTIDAAYEPAMGDIAQSASSYYATESYGHVIGSLAPGYYDTTQSIVRGWSGSPVLNENGNVWGIVSKCSFDWLTMECRPGYAIVAEVP